MSSCIFVQTTQYQSSKLRLHNSHVRLIVEILTDNNYCCVRMALIDQIVHSSCVHKCIAKYIICSVCIGMSSPMGRFSPLHRIERIN